MLLASHPDDDDPDGKECGSPADASVLSADDPLRDEVTLEEEPRIVRHIMRRTIPLLFVASFFCYLDRANISFAALQMNEELGFSSSTYGLGAGLFYASYAVTGTFTTLAIRKIGASRGIGIIFALWGIVSACQAFVQSTASFLLIRILLGVTESGFFPAMLFYLSMWFTQNEIALCYVLVTCATAVSGVLGGPLAGALMAATGWRGLFLIEGVPSVVLGVLLALLLPTTPEQAHFLPAPHQRWLIRRQRKEAQQREARTGGSSLRDGLRDPAVWALSAWWFAFHLALQAQIFFAPLVLRTAAPADTSVLTVSSLATIPFSGGAIGMLLIAWHSDRTRERRWHMAVSAAAGAAGLALAGLMCVVLPAGTAQLALVLVGFTVGLLGTWGFSGPFFAVPTARLNGAAAAVGFGVVQSIGNAGGAVGPYIMGALRDRLANFGAALFLIAGWLLVLALTTALLIKRFLAAREGGASELPRDRPLLIGDADDGTELSVRGAEPA